MSDERLVVGMRRQLELRDRMLADGARRLGWKYGLNAPPLLERLGLDAGLVGFLTDATLVDDRGDFTLPDGIEAVNVEPEIGVEIGADSSIVALMPALEIVHFDRPFEPLEDVLAYDIFHRGVVLGPRSATRPTTARVFVDGEQVATPELTADLDAIVATVGDRLRDAGEQLRAGDVIITGTLIPPPEARPGTRVRLELDPLGAVEAGIAG